MCVCVGGGGGGGLRDLGRSPFPNLETLTPPPLPKTIFHYNDAKRLQHVAVAIVCSIYILSFSARMYRRLYETNLLLSYMYRLDVKSSRTSREIGPARHAGVG